MIYRESLFFIDPRNKELGARVLSSLEKLHLTIKKLNLKIINPNTYLLKAFMLGIPIKGIENLREQLFGLEANFEELKAIDFKKGCYIGQENTARMKLKDKLTRKLMPIKTCFDVNIGSEIMSDTKIIGKILIDKPFPFALIKINDKNFKDLINSNLTIDGKRIELIKN